MQEAGIPVSKEYTIWRAFTDNGPDNPMLRLVEKLKSRGFDLDVRKAIGKDDKPIPEYVHIYALKEIIPTIEAISQIPEVRALTRAWQGVEPGVASCDEWDHPTRRSVRSLSFQRSAERGFSLTPKRDRTIAQNLLAGSSPLTSREIERLLTKSLVNVPVRLSS